MSLTLDRRVEHLTQQMTLGKFAFILLSKTNRKQLKEKVGLHRLSDTDPGLMTNLQMKLRKSSTLMASTAQREQ